ncbi:hypothetical protein GCM10027091_00690 [Streptomyces daliensis]
MLQWRVARCVSPVQALVADYLALQAQCSVEEVFREDAERFTDTQAATGHEPYGGFQARADGPCDGLNFVEAGKIPLVDGNHGVLGLVCFLYGVPGYAPVTHGV